MSAILEQLLFVCHRKEWKGIETLLRATAIARRSRPSITLRLVGRAPDAVTEARWHGLAAELGISGAVVLREAANRGEVAAAMRKAAVFVHPSPRETFGVVAAEALASGLPVVAADSGGVTEIAGAKAGAVWGARPGPGSGGARRGDRCDARAPRRLRCGRHAAVGRAALRQWRSWPRNSQ